MPDVLLNEFNRRNISFSSREQLNELLELLLEFQRNVRIWENNGHTPRYIFEKFERPALKLLPEKPFVIKSKKIGRNDPCPCGSGKKYKYCCFGKPFLN